MNQKKWVKKSSALLLAFCMVVSIVLQHLPMLSKASNGSPIPEVLGYSRVTLEDFGLSSKTYTTTTRASKGISDGLDMKYLDVDVTVDKASGSSTCLRLGGPNDYGITVYMYKYDGKVGIYLRNAYDNAGAKDYTDIGVNDDSEPFNLKLAVNYGDGYNAANNSSNCSVTYSLWVNNVLLEQDRLLTNSTQVGKTMSVQIVNGDSLTLSTPEYKGPTPEQLGYSRVTIADFGMPSQTYTGNTRASKAVSGGLDMKYLDVDVTIGKVSGSSTCIRFGGLNDLGFNMYIYTLSTGAAAIYLRNAADNAGAEDYTDIGVPDATKPFNMKLAVNYGEGYNPNSESTCSVTYSLWVNNVLIAQDKLLTASTKVGNSMSVLIQNGDSLTLGVPNRTPEELGYEKITIQDFGLDNGTYYSDVVYDDHYTGSYGDASLNMKYLDIDTSFEVGSSNSHINYGGNDGWHGIRIFGMISDGNEYLIIKDAGTGNTNQEYNLTKKGISIHEPFNIKLATKYVENTQDGTDVTYTLWLNNECIGSHTFTSMPRVGNMIGICAKEGNINIGTYTEKTLSPVSYDLSDGAYLVSGTKVSVYKDDELLEDVTSGTTITTPGDYTIKRTDNLTKYTQNISLYKMGDVNCDGEFSVVSDLAALQELLNGKTSEYKATSAAEYAADLDNDGNVGSNDLKLMQNIQSNTTTLEDVLDKYHVPALTYDYLGGDEVMPINGFYGPHNSGTNNYITDEVFQLIKESGVNLITYSRNKINSEKADTSILDAIALAEKYGLGYYVDDARLNTEITLSGEINSGVAALDQTTLAKKLSVYSHYENYLGTFLVDEPYPNVQAYNSNYKQLQYYDGVSKLLNGFANNNAFISAWPSYASWINSTTSYDDYLEAVVDDTDAKVLSFDHYVFEPKTLGKGQGAHNAKSYFTSLSAVRNVAKEKNIPFWGYVQAGGDFRDGGVTGATDSDKQPSEAETYWNVNTLLAFGAKGIGWFPLVQPEDYAYGDSKEAAKDYDRNGLLGSDATTAIESDVTKWTTPYYEYAKNMNKHIAAIDEVLMKAKSTAIIATGGYAESETQGAGVTLASSTEKLQKVETDNTQYGALVGCFDYRDTEAFYVVNYDVTTAQEITLTFDKKYDYRQIQDAKTTFGVGKIVTLTIPAGEAVLLVLEDRMVEVQDISEYRGATADANKAPDAEAGYVFGGWYEVTPADLGYSRVTLEDFGLPSKTYTGTTRASKGVSGGLDMKYLDVDVTIGKVSGSGTCIRFGGLSDLGFNMYIYTSSTGAAAIYIRNAADNAGAEDYTDIGVPDATKPFNMKLAVNYGEGYNPNSESTCSVSYSLWVNNVLIAQDKLLTASTKVGNSMSVLIQGGDSLTLSTPEYKGPTPEQLGYSRVTIADFGMPSQTYTGTTRASKAVRGGLDMKYLDVDVTIGKVSGSSTCIRFGGLSDLGFNMYIYTLSTGGAAIYLRNAADNAGAEDYTDIGVPDATKPFNMKLAVNYGEGYNPNSESTCSVTYSLWVNNVLIAQDKLLTASTKVGNGMSVLIQNGDSLTLGVPKSPETDTSEGRIPLASYKKSGMAYAKFVDDDVLTVKAQITANTKSTSDKADIRFVTTVDSLNYAEVGFMITPQGGTEGKKPSKTVYEKLYYVGKDSTTADESYLPTEFSSQSRYFNAYSYWNILNQHFGYTFTVTPYWKTLDGTTVYGQTAVKSVSMGITN